MKNQIRYISETEAQVTKAFQKKAAIFGTPEFKLWREYVAVFPNASMTTKTIRKNPDKKTYRNMTYKNMEIYIQKHQPELLEAFQEEVESSAIQTSPYRHVLAWFLRRFPDYDSYKEFFAEQNNSEPAEPTPTLHSLPTQDKAAS